jgi:hypothetical protein
VKFGVLPGHFPFIAGLLRGYWRPVSHSVGSGDTVSSARPPCQRKCKEWVYAFFSVNFRRVEESVASTTVDQGRTSMSLCSRRFLIADDGTLCRLANTRFDRMLRDPASHRLPYFAGQRVRMASVVVEVVDRIPVRVVRTTFAILTVDNDGRIDSSKFVRKQFALAETALVSVLAVSDSHDRVVDATSRFVAQGGSWVPSHTLARAIEDAALGRPQCRRL